MRLGFLNDHHTETFTGIGSAKEWKPIDYAVNRIRIKIESKEIREAIDLKIAIDREAIEHHLNKRDVRILLRETLRGKYATQKERSAMDSPAFAAAISPS
jgi:hypothetical protein